jgi:multiple sugar transport system ATP-binding protein
MAHVRFEHVAKSFGGTQVLHDVDLAIEEGELVTLVGPSGCGKSTLLNLLAGFERPTAGHVRIDERVVDDASPSARGLAMVFQSYALYPHLDVRRNIGFPLAIARQPPATIDARVREAAERLGLGAHLDRRPAELSGGQRQRVALARALVRRPRLCLFDEPLSNLDAALRAQMRVEIKKLHEELGATFVYVTHDQIEAMTLSDRVVVLHDGRIAQVGAPREVYDRPATTFVAAFFGSPRMSLVPPDALGLAPERDVIAGVRPEAVEVVADRVDGGVAGRVWAVEPTGPETWVTVARGDHHVLGRAARDFAAPVGAPAWFMLPRGAVHRFRASTGERLADG